MNSLGDSSPLGPNTPYDFVKVAEADHEYPITKVSWEPLRAGKSTANLLATTGDYLRLWELTDEPPLPGSRTKGIIMKGLCRSVLTLCNSINEAEIGRIYCSGDVDALE